MRAHAESINLEFERDVSEEEALEVLSKAAGVSMINDRSANRCDTMRLGIYSAKLFPEVVRTGLIRA